MSIPEKCLAAVFEAPNEPLRLAEFPVPAEPKPGAVLCRILLSTICGSDLHTTLGRRVEPMPSILGHESVGEVVAVGAGAAYSNGDRVRVGDRVSWTIMASCGACWFCEHGLPQKCKKLFKYGHASTAIWPGLTGGYGQYIYLFPGTGIFRVPEGMSDVVATPANCALATVVCAMETIGGVAPGESVLIAGAGLLGTYLAALAKEAGARVVAVADVDPRRAEAARDFGADAVYADSADPEQVAAWAREVCGGEGVDVAFEVCGVPTAATAALESLRVGGRLLIAGLVTPNSVFPLDGNQVTRRYLTVRGIHNYRPDHLGRGLAFLAETLDRYPYERLVSPSVALRDIHRAFELAQEGRYARVSVHCGDA